MINTDDEANNYKKFELDIDVKEFNDRKELGLKIEFPVYSFYIQDKVLLSAENYIKSIIDVINVNRHDPAQNQTSGDATTPKKEFMISKIYISPLEFNLFIIDLTLIIEMVQKKKYKYMLHLLQNLKVVYLKISRFQHTVN